MDDDKIHEAVELASSANTADEIWEAVELAIGAEATKAARDIAYNEGLAEGEGIQ